MANNHDPVLVQSIQGSAGALSVAATWASGSALSVSSDFLYEIFLLFSVLERLHPSFDLQYIAGVGSKSHAFPRRPAAKAGRPRFVAREKAPGGLMCEVCAGTQVRDIHQVLRGVDVSLQHETAGDDPTYSDLYLIMDAKYRGDPDQRITHPEFSEFARWIEIMQLRNRPAPKSISAALGVLGHCCIVTNGKGTTEPDAELRRTAVREVDQMYPNKTPNYRP